MQQQVQSLPSILLPSARDGFVVLYGEGLVPYGALRQGQCRISAPLSPSCAGCVTRERENKRGRDTSPGFNMLLFFRHFRSHFAPHRTVLAAHRSHAQVLACEACPLGTYSETLRTGCAPCTAGYECSQPTLGQVACDEGDYSLGGEVIDCTECPAGYFCASTSSAAEPCAAGTYSTRSEATVEEAQLRRRRRSVHGHMHSSYSRSSFVFVQVEEWVD